MKQFLIIVGILILTSCYIFPFNTVWLPAVNTKMALAAVALVLFFIRGAEIRNGQISKNMIYLSLCALAVSFFGLTSAILNNTSDFTYASYFVKMWVWLGGAYTVIKAIDGAYGKATVRLVGNFLIGVSVIQCFLAQLIHLYPAVSSFVDSFMVSSGFMGKHESRLYGIGCALDVAGLKFCAILIITAFFALSPQSKQNPGIERLAYILAFFIIGILGTMISRTAFIGIVLGFVIWVFYFFFNSKSGIERANVISIFKLFVTILLFVLPVVIVLYRVSPVFQENFRFGFEGFFSLFEKGEWVVRSNEQLQGMLIWPDNLKTWIIGDGYFDSPNTDIYYVGPSFEGYYMGTDVGYCRFIFYFGILGLLAFSTLFLLSAKFCADNNPKYAIIFWMIVLMNFIGWIKVSSDIFSVMALFIMLGMSYVEKEENTHKVIV